MTGHVVKLPRALRDLDEAAAYLQRRSTPQRAIRFLQAADTTLAMFAGMPGMGTRYEPDEPIYAALRYSPITRHRNDLVFYCPAPGGIEVLGELYGTRDIAAIVAEEFGMDAGAGEGLEEEPGEL